MKLEENAIEDELMVDLRRRLRVINSPEYRAGACYRLGDRVLFDAILWLALGVATVVMTLMVWL